MLREGYQKKPNYLYSHEDVDRDELEENYEANQSSIIAKQLPQIELPKQPPPTIVDPTTAVKPKVSYEFQNTNYANAREGEKVQ